MKVEDHVYNFLCAIECKTIQKEACICHACSKQIQRNISNPILEWDPKQQNQPVNVVLKSVGKDFSETQI